ncbi:MAG: cytochrome c oxidase subunit II [bacterium]|nr:cytochrome c oxidase subunit II [bacterium]
MFRFLPEQASTFAADVDWIHNWITDISVFFTVAIFGAAILFAIIWRRREGKDHATPQILGDHKLEAIWTIVPTLICVFVAVKGLVSYQDMRTPPANTLDISVTAEQFNWSFEYPNGKKTTNDITVPVGHPVKFIMRSKDVIHSFFIPAMRVKKDVLPSMFTTLWFEPIKTGSYQGFCTEYCGAGHSAMLFKVNVVSDAEYDRWLTDDSTEFMKSKMNAEDLGRALYEQKTCNTCHSIDGSMRIGPSFAKLWNKKEKLVDGTEVLVDENYIESSIVNPNAQVVAGYAPIMPSFEGQLSVDEIKALIAFIKGLEKTEVAPVAAVQAVAVAPVDRSKLKPEERGKILSQEKLCISCHSIDGSKVIGPSYKGIYGRKGKLVGGADYEVTDEYIKESILNPMAKVVDGYAPAMPPYAGQLSDDDINDIIAYLKTVK